MNHEPTPSSHPRRGQATIEWVGLVLLVSLALLGLLWAATGRLPGAPLAEAIAERLLCAVRLGAACSPDSPLHAAYGDDVAWQVRRHAPAILYERGMVALPVDFRRCRHDPCAEGAERGGVWRTRDGEPVTAFVHVIDCSGERAGSRREYDCTGERAGNLYIQYWFYYPGSATGEGRVLRRAIRRGSAAVGMPTYHPDDWESYAVRVLPSGRVEARASSHRGYNYRGGPRNWGSDVGWLPKSAWGPSRRTLTVSGGSHAGRASEGRPRLRTVQARLPPGRSRALRRSARRLRLWPEAPRHTPHYRLRLVPLEPIAPRGDRWHFAITPPWRKRVWRDPEHRGTD